MPRRFQLHHWDPDTRYTITEYEDRARENVDPEFEFGEKDWRPLTPAETPEVRTLHFVDGARRHDAAGTLDEYPCLFGVIGVGNVTSTLGRPVTPPDYHHARRYVIIASDDAELQVEPVTIPEYGLTYEPRIVEGGDQQVPAAAQAIMLDWEATRAEELARDNPSDLVVIDGPLRRAGAYQNVLGYVKTTQREPLPRELRHVLGELRPGQRTPVYHVQSGNRSLVDRLEWAIRPRGIVPGVDPRLGLVRIQANSSLGRERATALADWSAVVLPEYSTDYHHDARAPQQLLLIKNLENDLRRCFGNRDLLQVALRELLAT